MTISHEQTRTDAKISSKIMIELDFRNYRIELVNETDYTPNSADNNLIYENIFTDENELDHSTKHGIKVLLDEKKYSNALICAVGGATGIHEKSAAIVDDSILICCADKIFSLTLPNLNLNWMKKVDDATCFRIFNTKNGIFVHGELEASKIDKEGNIIWSVGVADILVTPDGKDEFIFNDDSIEIQDWNHTKYKVDFDRKFI